MNPGHPPGAAIETSLGPALEHHATAWVLDLSALPIFHGLSVISRALGEMIIDQGRSERIDIDVERPIRARENPELLRDLGVTLVKVSAERPIVARLVRNPEQFQDNLRALFGTLQRRHYREALFPLVESTASKALIFHFTFALDDGDCRCIFVLERMPSARSKGKRYLRITIEDHDRPRLNLGLLDRVVVEDLESRTFIAGSTRISQTWSEGVRREAERRRRSFSEHRTPHSHTFAQLLKAGLGTLEQVSITWTEAFVDRVLETDPAELSHVLKRVLLALEDRAVRSLLEQREVVRIVCDDVSVYVDRSQLGRVLNLSLGARRERLDLDAFLDRMPATTRVVERASGQPLAGVKVFLIHHITAETLGLIAALRRLGCRDLTTLFVAYAAEAPASYLGPLLDLPPTEFRCLALANVPDEESVEGRYRLSRQYSALDSEASLSRMLGARRLRFFEAMRAVAAAEFLEQVRRAEAAGKPCLVIEDGGYLAPAVNRACLEGKTVRAFAEEVGTETADERALHTVLEPVLLGSVEHTRNGFHRLEAVEAEHGRLAFPAFSIAISRHKTEVEAREVAVSVLNAVENVLHATGKLMSRRSVLVLGSRGAIGRHVMEALGRRLIDPGSQLAAVDLNVAKEAQGASFGQARRYRDLPEPVRRRTDLIIGVTGVSVLEGPDLERWLLDSERRELILASGSTKTEEFGGLAAWIDHLLAEREPRLGGALVHIDVKDLTDPITGRLYGRRYGFTIELSTGSRRREVVFLANLTPVNFMFYGVPAEVIDEVLAQLLTCALGLHRRATKERLPGALQAVDRDIAPDGQPLASAGSPPPQSSGSFKSEPLAQRPDRRGGS